MIYTKHSDSESSVDLEDREPIYEQDEFLNEHGYAWDYVLVFPISSTHRKPSIEDICHRLHAAGLSLKLFYSSTSKNKAVRRLVFCLVRAPPDLLKKEADRISLNMLLDETALKEAALQGYPLQNIQPFHIQDTLGLYDMAPYTSIHIKYSCRDDMQRLYLKRGPMNSLFSSTQRMLLTKSIMTNTHGGAGLDLYKILHNNTLAAFYPAHEPTERSELAAAWLSWHFWPWQQPLSSIQSYFGSKIALYFAFLAHYTTWLMGAGVVGLGLWIPQLLLPNTPLKNQVVVGCSSVFIVVWATLLMKSWGRYNATLAFHWGTTNFQATEQPRPQFIGRLVPSPITGRPMLYFDKREKFNRMCWSWLLLCGLIGLVAGLVSMNFYLQNYLIEAKYSIRLGSWDFLIGGPVANLANVAQIALMFQIYDSVCVQLNEIENHATESDHEGAFILKSILFHVINNFAALFYVMFVKRYIGVQCMNNDCLSELRISLLFIFGLQMLWGNLQQVLLPRLWSVWTACRVGHRQDHIHPLEEEFYLADYGWLGTFYDYLELVLQFGYTILFIGAFPATPLLSLINNVCEIRIDAYRLLNEYRRPTPRQAATAGQWVTVLEVLVTLSIFTNGFFLVYSSNVFDFPDNTIEGDLAKLRLFVLYVATLLLFRYSVSRYWENVPDWIQVQLKRQDFLSSKILGREADEVVPQFVRSESFQFKIDSMENRRASV